MKRNRNEEIRKLPDGELEVMLCIWDLTPPVSRRDVEERLSHPMAATTLLTVLSRLTEKGFLHAEKQGRGCVYTPLVEKSAYLSEQSRRFLRKDCGGSMSAFANALCSSGLTKEELSELKMLLEEKKL